MAQTKLNYELLSADNPVFSCYATWGSILLLKMLCMSVYTGYNRMRNKAFENPEDAGEGGKVGEKNDKVERIRRAHLNDLENIPVFLIVTIWYVLSNPNPLLATILIRIAVIARILHTIVYAIYPVRQPARASAFFAMYLITAFMAIYCIVCFHGF